MTTGIILALLAAIVALWFKSTKGRHTSPQKAAYNKEEAESFVRQLDKLGYFKYADASDLDSLKSNMLNSYNPYSELTSMWDEHTGTPKDYRYYFCDGETVYEQGGITDLLQDLQPTFDKLNFQCNVTGHFEVWDDKNQWLNHRITINGTKYVIFKNFTEMGWGEAPKRIAEILNAELTKQGKDEQIYLASGGNDGMLIFLTNELYQYIYSVLKDPYRKPLKLNEWAAVMEVEPMRPD